MEVSLGMVVENIVKDGAVLLRRESIEASRVQGSQMRSLKSGTLLQYLQGKGAIPFTLIDANGDFPAITAERNFL